MPENKTAPTLALELVGGETNARTLSEGFTPQLIKVAEEADDAQAFARRLAADPMLRDECVRGVALAKRLAAGCGVDAVARALQPLLIYFDPKDFGVGRAGAALQAEWMGLYQRELADLPASSLEFAVGEAVRTLKWFPKVSELRDFAKKHAMHLRMVAWRIQKGAEKAAAEPKRISSEDRAKVREMLIADGVIRADGKVDASALFKKADPPLARPRQSPQEMAAQIRRSAT